MQTLFVALITKNIGCTQTATHLLFLKQSQLHLTYRKYDTFCTTICQILLATLMTEL